MTIINHENTVKTFSSLNNIITNSFSRGESNTSNVASSSGNITVNTSNENKLAKKIVKWSIIFIFSLLLIYALYNDNIPLAFLCGIIIILAFFNSIIDSIYFISKSVFAAFLVFFMMFLYKIIITLILSIIVFYLIYKFLLKY